MAIITLQELVFLNKQRSSPISNFQPSESSIQQQQFQLLVRQKRMGLNIEPLLNPQLTLWLEQLEHFIPGIFKPRKKIYLNTKWKAQLQIDKTATNLKRDKKRKQFATIKTLLAKAIILFTNTVQMGGANF